MLNIRESVPKFESIDSLSSFYNWHILNVELQKLKMVAGLLTKTTPRNCPIIPTQKASDTNYKHFIFVPRIGKVTKNPQKP